MRLVFVEWVDSSRSDAWQHFDGRTPSLTSCKSVGWLLRDDKDIKVIAPHVSLADDKDSGQSCGDMTIPTRAVVRMVDLAEPQQPKRRRRAA